MSQGRVTLALAQDAIRASALDVVKVESLDGRHLYWKGTGTPDELADQLTNLAKRISGPFVVKACKARQIGQKGKRGFDEVALSWPIDNKADGDDRMSGDRGGFGNGLPAWVVEELIAARVERELRAREDEEDEDDDDEEDEPEEGIKGIADLVREITGALGGPKPEPKLEVVKDAETVAGAKPEADRIPFTRDEAAELLALLGRVRKQDPGTYATYLDMIRANYGKKRHSA